MIKVAAALRQMSDEDLEKLITQRMVISRQLVDFFDLAEVLTKPSSVTAAIAALPLSQARELRSIASGSPANSKIAQDLASQMLISPTPDFEPFDSTILALADFAKINPPSMNTVSIVTVENSDSPSQANVDRDAGIEIYETLQAVTELIFDLEHRFVREVGKKNVGLPDLKRLATHLSKTTDYAKQIYELATFAGVTSLANGRWQLSPVAESWLTWTPAKRFAHLAKTWRLILGDASSKELQSGFKNLSAEISLDQQLRVTYPFADGSVSSNIAKLANLAALIGLSAAGWMSSWTIKVLGCEFEAAGKLASEKLPTPQRKLICQADLTLIAPGPLPTDVEIILRRFADTEAIGMASTYRLSALSMSHGLETGLRVAEIRELLAELSGKPLPQPIEYLLNEAESRFARLRIVEDGERSNVQSSDKALLAEIMNEIKLKPFALIQLEDGSLASRFESEVLYFGLREAGFVAVRTDGNGRVISPLSATSRNAEAQPDNSVAADIQRLRDQEEKIGSAPDDDDLQRQIQLAIKNKAKATFTVTTNSGSEMEFLLEPIGIANGRLRAKDRKADIERTLPLTSIVKVTLN